MPVSYSGTAITWPDNSTTTSGWTGFKNRIINGAMMIDQRNAGASVALGVGGSGFSADRWAYYIPNNSSGTIQQVSDAPTGFVNSIKFTAGTGVAVNTQNEIYQFIEGLNVADLAFGTASASPATLSFWVKCSLTGTFNCSVINGGSTRSYVTTYTISAANTWEQKSVTIPGDTTGTWLKTNGAGIGVVFSLGQSATYQTTANTWAAGDYKGTAGAVSPVETTGATWQVTGVQLERGSTASSFEYRPYGTELALCQRYCQVFRTSVDGSGIGAGRFYSSTAARGVFSLLTTMRSAPSVSYNSAGNFAFGSIAVLGSISSTVNTTDFIKYDGTVASSSSTTGYAAMLEFSGTSGVITVSAEL